MDACGPPSPPTSLGERVGVRGAFASSLPTQATKRFRAAAAARATFLCLARETWPKERPPRWRALRPSMGSGCAGGLRGFSTAHPCTGEKLARIHASHPADFPPPARRAIGAPVKAARSRRALGRSRCAAAEAQRGALLIGITYGHAKHAISVLTPGLTRGPAGGGVVGLNALFGVVILARQEAILVLLSRLYSDKKAQNLLAGWWLSIHLLVGNHFWPPRFFYQICAYGANGVICFPVWLENFIEKFEV